MANIARNVNKLKAIELFALEPNLSISDVATKLGVGINTVYKWREDPNFIKAIYDRFASIAEAEIPSVMWAMIREGKSGNVQAARLVLEHSGKLIKNVNVTVDSPYDKWLKIKEVAKDADVIDMDYEEIDLPPRNLEDSPKKRSHRENRQIKDAIKKEAYNKRQREWYQWKKRAKAVGVEALAARRPTAGQRKEWQEEIVRRENEEKDS